MTGVIRGTTLTCHGAGLRHGDVNTTTDARPGTVLAITAMRPDHWGTVMQSSAVVCAHGAMNGHMPSICRAEGIPVVRVDGADLGRVRGRVTVDPRTGEVHLGSAPVATSQVGTNPFERFERSGLCAVAARIDDVGRVNRSAAASEVRSFFIREEFLWTSFGRSPLELLAQGEAGIREYVDTVTSSLDAMAAELQPWQRLVYRLLDLRSDDARDLAADGGPDPEPNPELGVHGARWIVRTPSYCAAAKRIIEGMPSAGITTAIPFVNDAEEYEAVLAALDPPAERQLGVFIETPAAAYSAADFCASRVDELFVGTKDLVQFYLAADRGHEQVSASYRMRHPAVVDALRRIAEAAALADTAVNIFMLADDVPHLVPQLPDSVSLMACVAEILASWEPALP